MAFDYYLILSTDKLSKRCNLTRFAKKKNLTEKNSRQQNNVQALLVVLQVHNSMRQDFSN